MDKHAFFHEPLSDNASTKALNDIFESFGEAYESYARFVGNNEDEIRIQKMVRHFLTANRLPIFNIDTDRMFDQNKYYFESTQWLTAFLEKHRFFQHDDDQFIGLDKYNRPIACIRVQSDIRSNLSIEGMMAKDIYDDLLIQIQENIKLDHRTDDMKEEFYYSEVVIRKTPMGEMTHLEPRVMRHTGETKKEFYPFLNGGVEALIEDFIQSDESVLILMGEPGTGKSTAISAACVALNLFPIYAKKTEVLENPEFISKIFAFSDDKMERAEISSGENARYELFKDRSHFENTRNMLTLPNSHGAKTRKEPTFPIVIVEDGDILLRPRADGNSMMAELLNETDGVGSATTRKIIITTNLTDKSKIEPALMRDGRHYLGEPLHFRMLTPMEAVEARAAAGLPKFDVVPKSDIPLATALRKPRKKIYLKEGEVVVQTGRSLN